MNKHLICVMDETLYWSFLKGDDSTDYKKNL